MIEKCEVCFNFNVKNFYRLFCCKIQFCKLCLNLIKINNFKCTNCGVKLYFVKKIKVKALLPHTIQDSPDISTDCSNEMSKKLE